MSLLDLLRRPSALAERLRAIVDGGVAPEERFEPALRAIVEFAGAAAGAFCLFDPRRNLLRLASDADLSDEGCRRLRTVRWGDPASWDIPLHGLVNRRAYLIENAARNRYVPRLLQPGSPMQSVVCVPVYSGPDPLGSLILVSVAPRSFGEHDVHAIGRSLPELARLVLAARRQSSGASTPIEAPPPQGSVQLVTLSAERDRLLGELAARDAESERLLGELAERIRDIEQLDSALAAAESARESLEAELAEARRELERLAEVDVALRDAKREQESLAETLTATLSREADLNRRVDEIERRRALAERQVNDAAREIERREASHRAEAERLGSRLHEAEATALREQRTREEHEAAFAGQRAALAEELRAAQESLGQAQAQTRRAGEERAAAEASTVELRTQLDAARRELAEFEAVVSRTGVDIERLQATAHASHAERRQLEESLDRVRLEGAEARARIAALEEEAARMRAELDAARERAATASGLTTSLDDLRSERDRLRAGLASAESERDRLRAELEGAGAALIRIETALEREASERSQTSTALTETAAALEALKAAHGRAEAEAAERAAEIARLLLERDQLIAERDAARSDAKRGPIPAAAVAPVRLAISSGGRTGRVRELEAGRKAIVVVDAESGWEQVAVPGHEVVVVPPDAEAAGRIASLAPTRIVVNLATRDALPLLVGVRENGSATRVWGCIAEPSGNRALALGMVEAAIHPLDPDWVVEALKSYVARNQRVVTAGADVDALMSLRQALSRIGISVSMAWDAKQAIDLLAVVKPQAAVVDLDLAKRDGYAVTAKLAAVSPAPHVVLLGGGAETPTAFAATLADPDTVSRCVPLDRLLAHVLEQSEAAPALERRPKIRALPTSTR